MALGRLLGGSCAPHGSKAPVSCLLYGSWAAFWRLLSHLGRLLGGPEAVFGTKLGRLGGILEAFWQDFHANMEPSWSQNSLNHGSYVKTFEKLKTFIFLL